MVSHSEEYTSVASMTEKPIPQGHSYQLNKVPSVAYFLQFSDFPNALNYIFPQISLFQITKGKVNF